MLLEMSFMEYLIIFYVFVIGLMIGSFINCLVWRLHKQEGLWNRSYCPKCNHQIAWYDNIPVLSYLILRAKCRHCKTKISFQYPVVELVTGVLFTISFLFNIKYLGLGLSQEFSIFNFSAQSGFSLSGQFSNFLLIFRDWFFIAVMIVVFIYDLRWYLILDIVTLPACIVIIIFNLFLGVDFKNMLLSGIIGGSFFLLQFVVSRGKWIGGGDVRLGLLMGLFFSWPMILVAIFLAYIIGSVISIGLVIVSKKKWGSEVPLGIFLTMASIITLFWGGGILEWYLRFLM